MSDYSAVKAELAKALADTNDNDKAQKVNSDKEFNAPSPKDKHETAYTTILDAYAANIVQTLDKKRTFKTQVFWLAFGLLVVAFLLLVGLLAVLICCKPFAGIAEWCSVMIPAMVSFVTVFIVIPQVITEYLFNSEEEKYMSEIIKNIQNYDKENHT